MSRTRSLTILVGHTGRDPDVRTTRKGTPVANFSLATNDGFGGEEKVNWHRCVAFGKLAGIIEKYVTKGDRLYIEGTLDYGSYEKDGAEVPTTEVIVDEMVMLGSMDNERGAVPATEATDESLPF